MLDDWYGSIEPEIRDVVRALRNQGINTTGSCGHEIWVECDSHDPTSEFDIIYNTLIELGYKRFEVRLLWDVHLKHYVNKGIRINLVKET